MSAPVVVRSRAWQNATGAVTRAAAGPPPASPIAAEYSRSDHAPHHVAGDCRTGHPVGVRCAQTVRCAGSISGAGPRRSSLHEDQKSEHKVLRDSPVSRSRRQA